MNYDRVTALTHEANNACFPQPGQTDSTNNEKRGHGKEKWNGAGGKVEFGETV